MSVAVAVEGLSKTYRLGTITSRTLGEDISRGWARVRGRQDPHTKIPDGPHDRLQDGTFWALEDVSFQVGSGRALGVVGRNGAGKSTLFKILSQVTAPSAGQIKVQGRVASLLEVGTGFHPELTGRENVFLNGAILGMTKAEVRKNFDEIVAFSECEAFIDTPVKRYSSGMYVRLAFAVAAHLESEILIVDEVLAVGDAQFQAKCLGKMRDVSSDGRTVLFVSHSMSAVAALCDEAILMSDGKVAAQGSVDDVAKIYHQSRSNGGVSQLSEASRKGDGQVQFVSLAIQPARAGDERIVAGSDVRIDVDLECRAALTSSHVGVHLYDRLGARVTDATTYLGEPVPDLRAGERVRVTFHVNDLRLKPGAYRVDLVLIRGLDLIDEVQFAGQLDVAEDADEGLLLDRSPGVYRCRFSHEVVVGHVH